jgi:hypothetical protein
MPLPAFGWDDLYANDFKSAADDALKIVARGPDKEDTAWPLTPCPRYAFM